MFNVQRIKCIRPKQQLSTNTKRRKKASDLKLLVSAVEHHDILCVWVLSNGLSHLHNPIKSNNSLKIWVLCGVSCSLLLQSTKLQHLCKPQMTTTTMDASPFSGSSESNERTNRVKEIDFGNKWNTTGFSWWWWVGANEKKKQERTWPKVHL